MFKSLMPNMMVESVEETIAFYSQYLGFSILDKVSDDSKKLVFAILSKDACILSFQLKSSLIEEYPSLITNKIQPSLTLFFNVKNAKELYQKLKDNTKIMSELHTTFYKTIEFSISDNNHNILTFSSENN